MPASASTPLELVETVYERFENRIDAARDRLGRALTLSEKILIAHLDDPSSEFERGVTYNDLRPDARCHGADGAAAVHDCWPRQGVSTFDCAL